MSWTSTFVECECFLRKFLSYEASEVRVRDKKDLVVFQFAADLDALEETEQKEFLEEMIAPNLYSMFVTPKDVDETVKYLSFTISEGLNIAFSEV